MSSQILLDVHDPSHDQILTWCRYAKMAFIGKKNILSFLFMSLSPFSLLDCTKKAIF